MPRESTGAHWFRAALSGAVGALIFVFPTGHEPVSAHADGYSDEHATEVMPPASAHIAPSSGLFATACTGAGNCVAVGDYEYGRSGSLQAFIATESHGRWARAYAPRLPANSSAPGSAQLGAVACTQSGFCEAVGSYLDSAGNEQVMALTKPVGGGWHQATEIASPFSAAANPDAFMTGIACTGTGSCVAVGSYSVSATRYAAMGAIESRGTWRRATGIAAPHNAISSTFTAISSISCPATGACLGVGEYAVSATQSRAMSVTESKGRFSTATEITAIPRGASLHPSTYLLGVSCTSTSTCLVVGGGRNEAGHSVAMYMIQSHGHWRATFLPAPARAGTGIRALSALYSVSCTGRDECTAVGYFSDLTGVRRAEAASTR